MSGFRDFAGRFVSPLCPDQNCGGGLVPDMRESWVGGPREPILRCDGLVEFPNGTLDACPFEVKALEPSNV